MKITSRTEKKTIYLEDPIKGKVAVGSLKRGKSGIVFRKNVERSKHYMRVVQGYGIQREVFDKFLRGKKGVIQIVEKDTGKFLVASIDTWAENSRAGNYGDGRQIFLAERFMHNSENFKRSSVTAERPSMNFDIHVYVASQNRLKGIFDKILKEKGFT